MTIQLTNADWLASTVLAAIWAPPPPVDLEAWAVDNVSFSERESPVAGPYNPNAFPPAAEILRALSPEDPCRIVSLRKSVQVGGTTLANIFCMGSLALDPGDFLYTHPTEDNARRWSRMKLQPMIDGNLALRRNFPRKSRDGNDSVFYKERSDGRGALLISGANSPSSLSQVSMRRQVQDDLSKWEMNPAGDPEEQADSRSEAHEFAKILKISSPLVKPGCRITRNYEAGSQEEFYVPCPHCQHMHVLEWENLLQNLDEEHPEAAHFTCPDCGVVIEDHHRPEMLRAGEWRAQNERAKREHRSFSIWAAYSLLISVERIARRWLKAKGDPASEQVFTNDVLGRAYEVQGEAPPWEALRDRAAATGHALGTIPAGFFLVACGVDCQADRVEFQVVAWGREFRRAVVTVGVVPGHISEAGCQAKLDALVLQTFKNAAGRMIGIDLLAIDGNAWTEEVWSWVKRHPASKVIMVRGAKSDQAPLLQRVRREFNQRTGKALRYSMRFYNFCGSILKMALYRNLPKTDPMERGFIALPQGLEDEYFRQLTAERRQPRKLRSGFVDYIWVKDPTQANEALDTMLQAEAAAIKLGVRSMPDAMWDRYEAERESPPDAPQMDFEDMPQPRAQLPAASSEELPRRRFTAPTAATLVVDNEYS